MQINTWATQFIHQVLAITHKQWLFRNARVQIRLVGGKTSEDHCKIMAEVLDKLSTPAETLLPQHQHLFVVDLTLLGEGTTLDRRYWLANVDSAVKASVSMRTTNLQVVDCIGIRLDNEVAALVPT